MLKQLKKLLNNLKINSNHLKKGIIILMPLLFFQCGLPSRTIVLYPPKGQVTSSNEKDKSFQNIPTNGNPLEYDEEILKGYQLFYRIVFDDCTFNIGSPALDFEGSDFHDSINSTIDEKIAEFFENNIKSEDLKKGSNYGKKVSKWNLRKMYVKGVAKENLSKRSVHFDPDYTKPGANFVANINDTNFTIEIDTSTNYENQFFKLYIKYDNKIVDSYELCRYFYDENDQQIINVPFYGKSGEYYISDPDVLGTSNANKGKFKTSEPREAKFLIFVSAEGFNTAEFLNGLKYSNLKYLGYIEMDIVFNANEERTIN